MSAVATETICFGETSISWTSFAGHGGDLGGGAEEHVALELQLQVAEGGGLRASAAPGRGPRRSAVVRRAGALAWATTYSSSSSAAR